MNKCQFVIVLTAFAIIGPPLLAEEKFPSVRTALVTQKDRLTRGEKQLAKVSPRAKKLLDLLERDLKSLTTKIGEAEPPPEFLLSLRKDANLLSRVNTERPTANDIKRLRRALASIDLKVHNLEKKGSKFALTWAAGLPEEPGSQKTVFDSLHSNLDKVGARIKLFIDFDEAAMPLFDAAKKDIRDLTILGEKHTVPAPYLLSLAQDAHLLALAADNRTPHIVATVYFRASAEDLHVKAESSRSANKKKSPFEEVETRVETRDPNNNKPKKGYEVWYVSIGVANDPRRRKRFNQFSTPSVEKRVPGRYEMWTKKATKEGEEAEIDVKDNGKGQCPVDLWIPK